ncbi:MAG: HlyC/CorC family transporter [Planctomycetes bacterium]|nr:HlyC/CorC family transporter [Planctomycetota bacterium]
MNELWHWVALPVLLCCSAFFSSIETALFSLEEADLERAGASAKRLMRDPQRVLLSVLLGNLFVNVLFFSVVSDLVPSDHEYQGLVWGAGALVTVLLFGEIVPKSLALRAPLAFARVGAGALVLFATVARPILAVARFALEVVVRALGGFAREESGLTTEDLAEVLESSAGHGVIEGDEADLLAEVVELEGVRVRELMTPRVDMLALDVTVPLEEQRGIVDQALERRHVWLPVVRESPDDVVGQVRLRELLGGGARPLKDLVRRVQFVPEVASGLDLLRVLRESKAAEAVVVDEYGGTAGIVTIEDVFEQILGDLRVEDEEAPPLVVALGEGRFRVAGALSIRDWNERFGHRVVPAGFQTIGGFVTALLGRIPRAGDRVRFGPLAFRVHDVRGRRVKSVDLSIEPAEVAR